MHLYICYANEAQRKSKSTFVRDDYQNTSAEYQWKNFLE